MKVLPRRRRAVLLNSVLGLVLLGGAGAAYAVANDGSSPSKAAVKTATVARGTVQATVDGSGSLSSPSDTGVDFVTGGTLTQVDVAAGDQVTAGEVLAKVDPTDADETLSTDQAALSSAQANLAGVEAGEASTTTGSGSSGSGSGTGNGSGDAQGSAALTAGPGSAGTTAQTTSFVEDAAATPSATATVNPVDLASAQAQVTTDENAVAAAQRVVAGTVITAPISGTVASVAGAVGQTVSGDSSSSAASTSGSAASSSSSSSASTTTGFVVITNPTGMEVTADFSEADALTLRAGQSATVTLNATGATLDAKVLSISSLPVSSSSSSGGSGGGSGSSSSAVQYAALLAITSSTSNLRTGLSASVQVTTAEATNALYVPTSAISGTGASSTVTVLGAGGSTSRVNVVAGVEGDTTVQVTSGVTLGEKVVETPVSAGGSNGFPSGAFPGGAGGGRGGASGAGAGLTGGGLG